MDIVLHLGAHRTASTSFQSYIRHNLTDLTAQGLGFWGPSRTRGGLFAGIIPVNGSPRLTRQARMAKGRIALHLERARLNGTRVLIVSDENMIGAPRRNMRDLMLYRGAGERMARHAAAFGGQITRIVLSIRDFDSYWPSVLAYGVARGHAVPQAAQLDWIASQTRGWRDVITDLSCALPDVDILVLPHEVYGGMPERRLEIMTDGLIQGPLHHHRICLNRAPDVATLRHALTLRGEDPDLLDAATHPSGGRYDPFTLVQRARLRELYQDDLFWLSAGADGLATLITENKRNQTGVSPQRDTLTRGKDNDQQEGRVA
jgi:hypothetical protein